MTVWNTKPVRDFLYTPDAADAIVKLLETDYTGPVNLGTGQAVSVGRIAEIIEKLSGKKLKIWVNRSPAPCILSVIYPA